MKKKLFLMLPLVVMILLSSVVSGVNAKTEKIPQVSFMDVKKGEDVTIVTNFMPENVEIIAYMGELDTKGKDGIVVGKMNTGKGGSFSATLPIPEELAGREFIVVRLEAPNKWYCFNTFQNDPKGSTPPPSVKQTETNKQGTPVYTETIVSGKPYKGYPIFAVKSVDPGKTVTVITDNFPPGLDFVAMIGKLGKNGEDGTAVGQFNSGEGGAFEATFEIPAAYQKYNALAIRLVAPKRYYAYNWFDNTAKAVSSEPVAEVEVTTTPVPSGETPAATPSPEATVDPDAFVPKAGGPRVEILSVVAGKSIKIKATNLHPSLEFTVSMGPFGEAETKGKAAGSFTSDNSGEYELEVEIPADFANHSLISVLLKSSKSYAYNYFYNLTTGN